MEAYSPYAGGGVLPTPRPCFALFMCLILIIAYVSKEARGFLKILQNFDEAECNVILTYGVHLFTDIFLTDCIE
jgi:hypothetical protein